jgi:putative transcriptional regulator
LTADEIRELRERMGISQTEFGKLIGVEQTVVSRWERGANRPLNVYAEKISKLAQKHARQLTMADK